MRKVFFNKVGSLFVNSQKMLLCVSLRSHSHNLWARKKAHCRRLYIYDHTSTGISTWIRILSYFFLFWFISIIYWKIHQQISPSSAYAFVLRNGLREMKAIYAKKWPHGRTRDAISLGHRSQRSINNSHSPSIKTLLPKQKVIFSLWNVRWNWYGPWRSGWW